MNNYTDKPQQIDKLNIISPLMIKYLQRSARWAWLSVLAGYFFAISMLFLACKIIITNDSFNTTGILFFVVFLLIATFIFLLSFLLQRYIRFIHRLSDTDNDVFLVKAQAYFRYYICLLIVTLIAIPVFIISYFIVFMPD